jgi:hypothetical protein
MNLRTLRWAILAYACFDLFFGGICGGFFPLSPLAAAQFTTVSGTVTDPNGLPYANGTITATLITSASPTLGGFPYTPPTQPTGLNSAGSFVMQLADNTQLSPGGTQWSFKVCSAIATVQPAFGSGPVCFTPAAITISGTSQNITAQLTAAALTLTARNFGKIGVFGSGGSVPLDAALTDFLGIWKSTTEALVSLPMPFAGTLKNLQIHIGSGGGNAGVDYTFTVRQNAASSIITCVISGTTTLVCADTTHSIIVATGDLIDIQCVPTASPNPVNVNWSMELDP